jgi:hypothetical protein
MRRREVESGNGGMCVSECRVYLLSVYVSVCV